MRLGSSTPGAKGGSSAFLSSLLRLAVLAFAAAGAVALLFVGVFVLLPLVFVGGIALHFYIRRRLRQAHRREHNDVIEAEYTVIKGD